MTDKEKLKLAINTLQEVRTIKITDGCGDCSSLWQHEYELKAVTKALKKLGAELTSPNVNRVRAGEDNNAV